MARKPAVSRARKNSAPPAPLVAAGAFTGTITTTGTSEAIRFEKALFRAHPEFCQKAKVRAHVIAPGRMLVSVEPGAVRAPRGEDAVLAAFLSFLDKDMREHPERIQPLDADLARKASALVRNVRVRKDETIPDDVTI